LPEFLSFVFLGFLVFDLASTGRENWSMFKSKSKRQELRDNMAGEHDRRRREADS
jgi:hypothetical protein